MADVRAVEVEVLAERADLVAGLLWGAGITALAEHPLEGALVVLRTDVPPGGIAAVDAAVGDLAVAVRLAVVDDGLDEWRDHAAIAWVGRRLVVHPPWVPLGAVDDDAVVIELDPGRSWGHGAHPTTRLCLAEVERLIDAGGPLTVLDVGCGSGALAIAAALLGSGAVTACDVDPLAIAATADNAARNAVSARVRTVLVDAHGADPLDGIDDTFELVVANIGAAALVDLAPHLLARLASRGTLVLSGVLDPPSDDVPAAFAPLTVARVESLDGWAALTLREAAAGDSDR